MEQLTDAVRRALAGYLALVQIDGEPGLGKTRLLDELERELDDVRVGRAACSELEQHLPYVPLAAALRHALGGIDLDVRGLPALGQILPELRLGADARDFDEVEVLEALVALAAEHAPFALLLDDLHHADASTVAALGYLRRRGGDLGVAIVTTARLGEEPADHPLGRLAPDMLLRLGPLSASELAPLGIPELHETTGGNPRFVAEALANGHRPECSRTLADALLAQCRAEGDRAYRVLAAASVLEQPFDPESLAALLGVDPAELLEELERLCERRFLRVDGLRFCFRYDLVRQVLLESVSPARRRLLLQRLAQPAAHELALSATQAG
jgi:predicted ATPase